MISVDRPVESRVKKCTEKRMKKKDLADRHRIIEYRENVCRMSRKDMKERQ